MEERIREKAYQLYLESGKKENRDIENWNNAKNILSFNNNLSLEEFKELLSFGIDFNYSYRCGDTLLHILNSPEKIKLLLDADADPNIKNGFGKTPIFYCYSDTQIEKTKLLLKYGANPDTKNRDGYTVLHLSESFETTKLLLENGADPNIKTKNGCTVLHFSKSIEITKLLLENGADPNIRGGSGITVLMYSNYCQMKLFLDYGVDPNIQSTNGLTALHVYSTFERLKTLLKYGANPNIQDNHGRTVLHFTNVIKHIKLLLEYGADLYIKNIFDETPLYKILHNKKKDDIQELLKFLLEREIKNMNAICSFQNIYRNRLMNPNHPFCKRKLEEDFNNFQNSCSN